MFGFDSNFKTININEAQTNGAEVFLKADLTDELIFKVNYTYLNARDKSENTPDYNQKLVRRPDNKAGLYISYSFNNDANVNIDVMYVGNRDELDFSTYPASRIVMPEYFLINLAAYYNLFSFLRLQCRIENLLDKQYEEIYGYGTAGFSFYGGINLRVE
jgi:vitamin B12 transporter